MIPPESKAPPKRQPKKKKKSRSAVIDAIEATAVAAGAIITAVNLAKPLIAKVKKAINRSPKGDAKK